MEFLPLDDIVKTLDRLVAYRNDVKATLDEITGMGDVLRGAGMYVGQGPMTATEASAKTHFASLRTQALQDEFARFASELQALKGEIVCKHYSPETIFNISNIQRTFNTPQEVQKALELLKSDFFNYRVAIKSDKLAMTDFAKQKNERVQWMSALGGLVTSSVPLIQAAPALMPFVMECVKWSMAAFEGSADVQGILDQAIQQMQQQQQMQAQQGPPPDPKLISTQMKGQMDLQKAQHDAQARMMEILAEAQARKQEVAIETQSDIAKQAAQAKYNTDEAVAKTKLDMMKQAQKAHHDALKASMKPAPVVTYKPNGKSRQ